jgi:hypothetical protein
MIRALICSVLFVLGVIQVYCRSWYTLKLIHELIFVIISSLIVVLGSFVSKINRLVEQL